MPESPLQLPPLQQATLDRATVTALFADLANCTQVLAVIPRHATRTLVAATTIDLATAQAELHAGTLRGVQIRYRHERREWCDTLLPLPDGAARLVRICTDDVVTGTAT